jgi:hypothetical protein
MDRPRKNAAPLAGKPTFSWILYRLKLRRSGVAGTVTTITIIQIYLGSAYRPLNRSRPAKIANLAVALQKKLPEMEVSMGRACPGLSGKMTAYRQYRALGTANDLRQCRPGRMIRHS